MGKSFQSDEEVIMSKSKNAYVIDPYSRGSYHEVINQSYLMMIASLYERVIYIADKSSCENLKKLLTECHFDYSNVVFVEKHFTRIHTGWDGLDYLLLMILTGWLDFLYYMRVKDNSDVFYNNNIYEGISLIKLFSFGKSNRIFDMCHSDMEHIEKGIDDTLAIKFFGWYLRHVFKHTKISRKIHFILLSSDMVKIFLKHILPVNQELIFSIDHAYIRPGNVIVKEKSNDGKIRIGIPGAITPTRGLGTLKYILEHLTNENVIIYSLSFVNGNINSEHFVELNKTGGLLPFEEYNANVQKMDLLLLLYDKDSYKLTASGAVLEAIWDSKPIIALENYYFRYLFNKFGDLGILCDSLEDLTKYINSIQASNVIDTYNQTLQKAKEQLMPRNVVKQLEQIVR